MQRHFKTMRLVCCAFAACAAAPGAQALPFDAIVPTVYHINSTGTTGVGTGLAPLILPNAPMTQTDLDNMVITAVEFDIVTDVNCVGPVNSHVFSPAGPGDVIGLSQAGGPFAYQSAALDALVLPGETFLFPGASFFGMNVLFPVNQTGTVTVHTTISSGSDYVDYTFDVILGNFPDAAVVAQAQRLSSVPEPASALLPGLGGLLTTRRRR